MADAFAAAIQGCYFAFHSGLRGFSVVWRGQTRFRAYYIYYIFYIYNSIYYLGLEGPSSLFETLHGKNRELRRTLPSLTPPFYPPLFPFPVNSQFPLDSGRRCVILVVDVQSGVQSGNTYEHFSTRYRDRRD